MILGGPICTCTNDCVTISNPSDHYSPYTFTVIGFDLIDPASFLTIHLYLYCPLVNVVLVVYDVVLPLLTVVQLLPELLLSQKYVSPRTLALHMRVMFFPIGTTSPVGCSVICGGSKLHYYIISQILFFTS